MITQFSAILWLLHIHIILKQTKNEMAPPYHNYKVDETAKSLADAKAKREALMQEAQRALEQEEALKLALAAESAAREKRAAEDDLGVFMTMFDGDDDDDDDDDDDQDKINNNKNTSDGNTKGGDDGGGDGGGGDDDDDDDDEANILVVNKKSPRSQKTDFIGTSSFVPGAFNVILPGPWVTFWCADCGRKLASRSIHEHWLKAHDDKHNMAGLQNVANNAMDKLATFKGGEYNVKKRAAAPITPARKAKTMRSATPTALTALTVPTLRTPSPKTPAPKKPAPKTPAPKTPAQKPTKVSAPKTTKTATTTKGKAGKGPQLFGVRTQTHAKNPFFQYVDKTPDSVAKEFDLETWVSILGQQSLNQVQYAVAYDAILQHFNK